jgi:hypothetical protein
MMLKHHLHQLHFGNLEIDLCHHIGPFHTPLESDSRSYVPDSMTKIILQRVCHYGIFILYFLINWGLNRTPPIGITLFAKL